MLVRAEEFESLVRDLLAASPRIEGLYRLCLRDAARVRLRDAAADGELGVIMREFLLAWGNMHRVLNARDGWEGRCLAAVRRHAAFLERARRMDIRAADPAEHSDMIGPAYEDLREIVAPTCAAKVLHLLAPRFFPPWDAAIREIATGEGVRGLSDPRGRGYVAFMQWCRSLLDLEHLREPLARLGREYHITAPRVLDCYLWMKAPRE